MEKIDQPFLWQNLFIKFEKIIIDTPWMDRTETDTRDAGFVDDCLNQISKFFARIQTVGFSINSRQYYFPDIIFEILNT